MMMMMMAEKVVIFRLGLAHQIKHHTQPGRGVFKEQRRTGHETQPKVKVNGI